MRFEEIVDGAGMAEGPVYLPDDTLIITSFDHGVLYKVFPREGRKEVFADTRGGANGAALCADGGILVTQAGGVDWTAVRWPPNRIKPTYNFAPLRRTEPGLQYVQPDGTTMHLLDAGFQAPNDLVVDSEGVVYFTDPPADFFGDLDSLSGRVWAYHPDRRLELVAAGFYFCNGIGLDLDENLVVVERRGLQRVDRDGSRSWIIQDVGAHPDGFCLDEEGRFYVAASSPDRKGIHIIDDGTVVDVLEVSGQGNMTNCCFGGDDRRTLYATLNMGGRVVAWSDMPVAGRPLYPWNRAPANSPE